MNGIALIAPVLFGYGTAKLRRSKAVQGFMLFMAIVSLLPAISAVTGSPDTVLGMLEAINTPQFLLDAAEPCLNLSTSFVPKL